MWWLFWLAFVWMVVGCLKTDPEDDDDILDIFVKCGPLFLATFSGFFIVMVIFTPFKMLYDFTKEDLESYWKERGFSEEDGTGMIFMLNPSQLAYAQRISKEENP
jgi:hypothetical protein